MRYLCIIFATSTIGTSSAFLQVTPFNAPINIIGMGTAHFMGRKVKPSMVDRRKKRAKRATSPDLETVRTTEKVFVGDIQPSPPPSQKEEVIRSSKKETSSGDVKKIGQKSSSILESQRRSVDVLTYIRKRVEENFPVEAAAESLNSKGYFVHDGFLNSQLTGDGTSDTNDPIFGDELVTEMLEEGINMLSNDKLERDIIRLGEGEFVSLITGGDKYVDCPRLTEFVVCMTRHLPPLMNNKHDEGLSDAASMGSIRMFDRKTKLGTSEMLGKSDDDVAADKPFGVVCENDDDSRRVTAYLFLSQKDWDCGGGISICETGESIDAIRDRIVLLRSDTCSHRLDAWKGNDLLQQAGCVTIHFVKS